MSVTSEGLDRLKTGGLAYGHALRLIELEGPSPQAESILRSAFEPLRSAMNWLEDTSHFETAHQRLDGAGQLAREIFPHGCHLTQENLSYYQQCPVALAHNRVGMSPGYVVREAECSICRQDPEDCPHIKGRVYDGQTCHRIIKQLDVLEVSFVGRPAQPDARIHRISVGRAELEAGLGEAFTPGVVVTCDRCLKPCRGVARPFEDSHLTLE